MGFKLIHHFTIRDDDDGVDLDGAGRRGPNPPMESSNTMFQDISFEAQLLDIQIPHVSNNLYFILLNTKHRLPISCILYTLLLQ